MKVILLENVKNVGKEDEVVDVSLGYAQNFLIKKKKAVNANKENLAQLNKKMGMKKETRDKEILEANKIKKQLENQTFEFEMNLGGNGNVFGKISTKQIMLKLKEKGFNVDRKKIKTEGIGHLGEEEVIIELDKDVQAKIKINVTGV